jgi:hypothetical protein
MSPGFTSVYAVATFGCQGVMIQLFMILKQWTHRKRVLVVNPELGTNSEYKIKSSLHRKYVFESKIHSQSYFLSWY